MQEFLHPFDVGPQPEREPLAPFRDPQAGQSCIFPIRRGCRAYGWIRRCARGCARNGSTGRCRHQKAPLLFGQSIRPPWRRLFASEPTVDWSAAQGHRNPGFKSARNRPYRHRPYTVSLCALAHRSPGTDGRHFHCVRQFFPSLKSIGGSRPSVMFMTEGLFYYCPNAAQPLRPGPVARNRCPFPAPRRSAVSGRETG